MMVAGMTCNINCYSVSLTGNTLTAIDFIEKYLGRSMISHINNFNLVSDYSTKIVIGTYTYGNGKIPKYLKEFLIRNQHNFKGKEVFIFGSGNSMYPHYNKAVDSVKKIIEDCGGKVIGTMKFEQRFSEDQFDQDELEKIKLTLKNFGGTYNE